MVRPDAYQLFAMFSRADDVRLGRASCLGKSMALWEIRTVVARLVAKYHVNFADGEDGSRVEGDEIDTFNLVPGELELSFKLRD